MSRIEVISHKRKSLPCISIINEEETNRRTNIPRSSLRTELQINVFKQNKYIAPIVNTYQLQENELTKKFPEIVMKSALNILSDPDINYQAPEIFKDKLRKINTNYGFINRELNIEMTKWMEHRQKLIENLQRTFHTMRVIQQTTSAIALISSTLDLARGIGSFLNFFFAVDSKPKYSFLLACIIGGISVTSSIIALSYTKQTAEDIFRDLREEKYILRNILIVDRRGNTVDEEIENLFPHGIDLDLVTQIVLDTDEFFMDDWEQYIVFAILLENFKKNKSLIHDKTFHASVKLLVKNPAMKIWLYRIKLRKLLQDTYKNLENHLDKKIFAGNEIFDQAAVNLYPIFFPLFVDARNMEKLRFICSSMTAISAVVNLNKNKDEGFQGIRRTSEVFMMDYKNLRKFNQEFLNDYD